VAALGSTPPVLDIAEVSLRMASREARAGLFKLDVDRFVAHKGEAIALIGQSGSGKSTLLNLIGLAQRPDRAATFALRTRDGREHNVAALWDRDADALLTGIRARYQGYVMQQGGLLPFLDVRGNIALALDLAGRRDSKAVQAVAGELGIAHLLDRRIGEISVGQRQRVAIARALVHEPDILLADEPTANVHPAMADEILELLCRQAERHGALLLMATHDIGRAAQFGFDLVEVKPRPTRSNVEGTRSSVSRIPTVAAGRA
jgi:putative ABC transport system ATP-binding protein